MFDLRQLRVAFVAGTLGQGGAEQQLFYMLGALKRAGAEVSVFCLTRSEFWESRIQSLGVCVEYVGERASRVARVMHIVQAVRRVRPHVVQSQHFYTNLYAVAAARAARVAEIGAIRNDARSEVRANGRMLGTCSLRVPHVLAANSRTGVANAVAMGVSPTRVRLLPNVVDTHHFKPADSLQTGALRLLAVGRLTEQKRFDRLLHAVSAARAAGTDVRVTIAGAGPLHEVLEAQAATLGLTAPILHFAGAVADMRTLYDTHDALVLTSEWEGTPNVIMEAMASGLAVFSTDVGGVADLVQDGDTGVLVRASGDAEIVAAFRALFARASEDREWNHRLGCAGRRRAEAHQSVAALPRVLSELYASVLT